MNNETVNNTLKQIVLYQREIDELKEKQRKLQATIAEENKKLTEKIKDLEERKINVGKKIIVGGRRELKKFKIPYSGFEICFTKSVKRSITQRALRQIVSEETMQEILDHPLVINENLIIDVKAAKRD